MIWHGRAECWHRTLTYCTTNATYHVTLVVHVCAIAHLAKWVFEDCLGGSAKRARPRKENLYLVLQLSILFGT